MSKEASAERKQNYDQLKCAALVGVPCVSRDQPPELGRIGKHNGWSQGVDHVSPLDTRVEVIRLNSIWLVLSLADFVGI